MKYSKYIANIITAFRIIFSIVMIFLPVFSLDFYIIYFLCGFSDMIDGAVARKTKSDSKFGEKFDSIADLVFVTAATIKILPTLDLPVWLWLWIILITIIKICNITISSVRMKGFTSPHTPMNKITGILLFILPFTLSFIDIKYSSIVVSVIATFSVL